MTRRLRTFGVLAVIGAVPTSAQEHIDTNISPEQRQQLEMRTCQAWHAKPIDALHTEVAVSGSVGVSIDCAVHGEFRGHPLRSVAYCEGADREWKCDDAGLEMDLGSNGEPRLIRMVDVSPEKALEIHAFIAAEARKGKRIRSPLLEGYLTLAWFPDGSGYSATFEFYSYATSLEILEKCGKRGCRYRLGDIQTYATYRDL